MTSKSLNILYLDSISLGLSVNIDMLHNHLVTRGCSDIGIHIHTPIDSILFRDYNFITAMPTIKGKDAFIQYAIEQNIDIIHDPYQAFDDNERWAHHYSILFVTSAKDLYLHIEAYLAGFNIAWLMEDPIFNATWIMKYDRRGGLTHMAFKLLSMAQEKGYSVKQQDYTRAILNKLMHIEYARDQLYHYLILKRRSKRGGGNNRYSFELTYHLTSYTYYICSVMDTMARLLNSLFSLDYGVYQNYGIEKKEFIRKLAIKRKTLADILALKKYNEWAVLIKLRRNDFTHSSHVYMTPMLMKKKETLSEEELETLVDQSLDWSLMDSTTVEAIASMRAMIKQNLEIEHNYDVAAEDIMTLEKPDRDTGQIRQYVIRPLNAINGDFEMISKIIERTLDNLSRARRRSPQ